LKYECCLVTVPVYWISRQGKWEQLSIAGQRKQKTFPTLDDYKKGAKQLLQENARNVKGLIQDKFESAANDQFPFSFNLTQVERGLERN
jgi:hypothetical protein